MMISTYGITHGMPSITPKWLRSPLQIYISTTPAIATPTIVRTVTPLRHGVQSAGAPRSVAAELDRREYGHADDKHDPARVGLIEVLASL